MEVDVQPAVAQDEPIFGWMWIGRARALMDAFGPYLDDGINSFTPGRLLQIAHGEIARFSPQDRTAIVNALEALPLFDRSGGGFYHHSFLRQLEHVCEIGRDAHAKGLIPFIL